jgi:two-component system, LytTR family, sensor kinase
MDQSYLVLTRLLNNRYRKLHHAMFIGLILFFWFLFGCSQLKSWIDVVKLILYASTYVIIVYFNLYFLFWRYFMRGRFVLYAAITVPSFLLSYVTQSFIYFKSWEQWHADFTFAWPLYADMMINAITYYMFIGIGLSVKMMKMWINSVKRISSLEQENLKATLANLKSQVSPHFLFNTFNNLYVLSKTNPKLASEMILGFADLMRYQLNESAKEKVDIENEINYIKNFLTLEKLRKDRLDLVINYDRGSLAGIQIEPLLFVTLIENAVKHGSQQMESPFIHVNLQLVNNTFNFEVVNSKPLISLLGKEESLKKGIDNLKKRLNLSYPLKHSLELTDEQTRYVAKLQIQLS